LSKFPPALRRSGRHRRLPAGCARSRDRGPAPGDRFSEVEEKVFDWVDAGTRLVIVLDPCKRTGTAYRSRTSIRVYTDAETLDASDVVPGRRLAVAQAFD